jgi:predicted GH43/DUF377 family glycosyl hydrolase
MFLLSVTLAPRAATDNCAGPSNSTPRLMLLHYNTTRNVHSTLDILTMVSGNYKHSGNQIVVVDETQAPVPNEATLP